MRARSSVVERSAHNRLVPGSNPGGPTRQLTQLFTISTNAFMLEN